MSLFLYPTIGQAQSNKKRSYRIVEVAMLSHTAFFLAPPELGLFCFSLSSPKIGLCMFIQNQTSNLMLHLVNIPCYVVQRIFDANTLPAVYKKISVSWSPGKAMQEDCQGINSSTLPKSFRNIFCHLCVFLPVMAHVKLVLVYTAI